MRTKANPRSTPSITTLDVPCSPLNVVTDNPYAQPLHAEPFTSPRLTPPPDALATGAIYSSSMTPSSPSYPSSPPPLVHARSPYANVDLPPLLPNQEGNLALDRILHPASALCTMQWDVRSSPKSLVQVIFSPPTPRPTSPELVQRRPHAPWHLQPACDPALCSIVVRTSAVPDRPIVVFPSGAVYPFITVYDVLDTIYRAVCRERVVEHDDVLPSRNGRTDGKAAKRPSSRDTTTSSGSSGSPATARGPERACGWRWGGLTVSRDERDVWVLSLY